MSLVEEFFTRQWQDLVVRADGPMRMRLIVQPTVACILALGAGLRDARAGRPPLFWAIAFHPNQRGPLLRHAWRNAGRVFLLGVLLDVIYQIAVLHRLYPGEAIFVAVVLVMIPYAVVRATVARLLWILTKRRDGLETKKLIVEPAVKKESANDSTGASPSS